MKNRHLEEKAHSTPSAQSYRTLKPRQFPGMKENVAVDCGWGQLIFAHTFHHPEDVSEALTEESPERRDIAIYVRDPQVILAQAPQRLFLDPSHTYRLWQSQYRGVSRHYKPYLIRRAQTARDVEQMNAILEKHAMKKVDADVVLKSRRSQKLVFLVAVGLDNETVLATVMGVDHKTAFGDPELGSSLWSLAVDPACPYAGAGEVMTRHLAEYFFTRGRRYMDLSVLYDNTSAIALYEKIGFKKVPVFSIKNKNSFNEPLFSEIHDETGNIYADIILKEARRRGILIDLLDRERGFFQLTYGGRTVLCHESLSDLTSATTLQMCSDKVLTSRLLNRNGVATPEQNVVRDDKQAKAFLTRHGRVVVKPREGEQGRGVCVGISTADHLTKAILEAKKFHHEVLIEECIPGIDLRVVVIDFKTVAASVRKPPAVTGTGLHTIEELIQKQNRKRAAAGLKNQIPLDDEVRRCLKEQNLHLGHVLTRSRAVTVRKTANLHTGGTIHDVTNEISAEIRNVCENAARALNIPVAGFDLIVPSVSAKDYRMIEVNERPGLANHEPQPTAQRFIDLLFPQTALHLRQD